MAANTVLDWTLQRASGITDGFATSVCMTQALHSRFSREKTEVHESTKETANTFMELYVMEIETPETQVSMSADFVQKAECSVEKRRQVQICALIE